MENTKRLEEVDPRTGKGVSRVFGNGGGGGGGSGSGSGVRKAFPVVDAGSGSTISCYLDTDLTGTVVTVNCSLIGGSNLNDGSPLLATGSLIFISSVGGEWWCISPFDVTEECACTSP